MAGFLDGVRNVINGLVNQRNAHSQNEVVSTGRLSDKVLRETYKVGIHNKALRLKTGHALKNTIQFGSTADREFFDKRLAPHVKKAVIGMLNFGRGVIVIHAPGTGDDVSKPLPRNVDPSRYKFDAFFGDMVYISDLDMDLSSPTYYKPLEYTIRGQAFHYTRVIDFTYVEPSEYDAPTYRYGGISDTELVYTQLTTDGIVERASATIVEKASTFIYKITGFKDALRAKKDDTVIKYFAEMENLRSIYGAVLLDNEDDATAVNQQLSNLPETNDMSLRRLAMVYGIPLPWLVGENVKGMNAVGENERQIFQDMIESLQSDYILAPLNRLADICQFDPLKFKENQGETPSVRVQFDGKAIDNALKLWQMGEDHSKYLEQKGVIEPDDWEKMFDMPADDAPPALPAPGQSDEPPAQAGEMNVDPASSLNGAQVTAILEIIQRIRDGKITRSTAERVIATSFPVDADEARQLIAEVPEGADNGEASDQ